MVGRCSKYRKILRGFEANSIANVASLQGQRTDIWRRAEAKHCSSLCSQSEGHEHVANMTNALGMTLLDFQLVLGRHK